MKKLIIGLLITLFSAQSWALPTLIHNVKGYTFQDNQLTTFDSILFENGVVLAVGSKDEITKDVGFTISIDGKGNTLIPGFSDAHGHLLGLGLILQRINLWGIDSVSEAVEVVAKYAKDNPDNKWILGIGWNQELWLNKEMPYKSLLDVVVKDRPVFLTRVDGHAAWANSKALEVSGITKDTPDPEGGKILRDEQGQPTGVLIDTAMGLVRNKIPSLTKMERQAALHKALDHLVDVGITAVHDAGVDYQTYLQLIDMSNKKQLPIRVYAMLNSRDPNFKGMLRFGKIDEPFLKVKSVKVMADGALGSRGAALMEPYADEPDNKGLLILEGQKLDNLLKLIAENGFQANIHAIGDATNHLVLDALEKLPKKQSAKALRHRIEHAQIVHPDDLPRFAELNIIASMQPTHATSDMHMAEDRLGKERLEGAYAWQTMLENNVLIAAGSDFPVEKANPMLGFYAAVTRQDLQGEPDGGWLKDQIMTRAQTFKAFTIDAAYAGFLEKELGSLEKDKKADFILLNQDIFEVETNLLPQTQVLQTWVDGKRLK